MKIAGILFCYVVMCASGARGFFGEGYWFHTILRWFGWSLDKTTLVTKTATLHEVEGNMHVKNRIIPMGLWPKCIVIKWLRGVVLNAIGLTNPGIQWLLDQGKWQRWPEPFVISVTSIAETKEQRLAELKEIVALLKPYKYGFQSAFALEDNVSCPNTGHDRVITTDELAVRAKILKGLGVPVFAKFSAVEFVHILQYAAGHYDASVIGNTVPYGDERIDWPKLFGKRGSPLARRGYTGGGLSAPEGFAFALDRAIQLRERGIDIALILANGIRTGYDVERAKNAHATTIATGSCLLVRPWNEPDIIQTATALFSPPG